MILANQKINQNINKLKNIFKKVNWFKIKQSEVEKFNITLNEIAIENHMKKYQKFKYRSFELKILELNKIDYDQYKKDWNRIFMAKTYISTLFFSNKY